MKKLIIIGCGGASEVIADAFTHDSDFEVAAFSVERAYLPQSLSFCGLPVVPYEEIERHFPVSDFSFFVGVGGNDLNALRYRFFSEMCGRGYAPASFVSSRALVSPKASLGMGCLVLENVVIHAGCKIGDNVMIWPNAYTGHHSVIESHCFIASGVTIAGYAHIKEKTFLGAGACVANSITIGAENFITMGTCVTQPTEDNSMVKSAPATVTAEAKKNFSSWHKRAAASAREKGNPRGVWYDYVERPKTCAPDDFWGQVRRTVNGKPISQEQIDLLFDIVRQGLPLEKKDILLDLACGNGRLGYEFFEQIHGYLGVDLSPCLIEIARQNFERPPSYTFETRDVASFCREEARPDRFSKALCFGSFAYFSDSDAHEVLTLLRERFTGIDAFFIGPIPDKDRAEVFSQDRKPLLLDDHTSSIGRWYTKSDFTTLCSSCGWNVAISEMPPSFYQAHYRFNVILTPGE